MGAEPSLFLEAFKGLIAAGPVAMVLGVMCWGLWRQNQELQGRLDSVNEKMLRLAVRVQRAIEVLADLDEQTEVDNALDDDGDARRKERDRDRNK